MHLRNITVIASLAAALALVPAQAIAKQSTPEGVYVCQVNKGTGDLVLLTDGDFVDPQGAPITEGLAAKRNGNLNSAMHSPNKVVCGAAGIGLGDWSGTGV